jgi:hypothetical protein
MVMKELNQLYCIEDYSLTDSVYLSFLLYSATVQME